MEGVKRIVGRIASTPDHRLQELPLLHRSLLPVLSLASAVYRFSLLLHRRLYLTGLLPTHRLPVPVISVGNLTWGGNGKTPMVEFLARFLDDAGIPPLILTRGYAGGDEAKMLQRHLFQTSTRIGIGSNRSATAASVLKQHGYVDSRSTTFVDKLLSPHKSRHVSKDERIGAVILDDGMQHWSLSRDVEVVMVNILMPWGNGHLLPRGPLREPFAALSRADIVVIYHADLVSDEQLKVTESMLQKFNESLPIFFSRLSPSYFFEVKNYSLKLPISVLRDVVVLCVSAIGFPGAFIQHIKKMGPLHIGRLDFSDHHFIRANELKMIKERLQENENRFKVKPVIVMTEKDYYRDPHILEELYDLEVLVLCSILEIMSFEERTVDDFKRKLKKMLTNE